MADFQCSICKIRKATQRLRVEGDSSTYVTHVEKNMLFCKTCAQQNGLNVIPAIYWERKKGFYGELLLPYV